MDHALDDTAPDGGQPRPVRRITIILAIVGLVIAFAPYLQGMFGPGNGSGGGGHGAAQFGGAASPEMFNLKNPTIDIDEIYSGGVSKDGIPALTDPDFLVASEADYMRPDDEIIAYEHNGDAHAYPLRILVWHEIANDTVGGKPVAATYCPLCGTAMMFGREVNGRELTFGVSGLLYHSDVLMYDHQTESLWSQLKMECVAGEFAGQKLEWLASDQMKWSEWKEQHPGGKVLSTDTGHMRNYNRMPYQSYFASSQVKFPVPQTRRELPMKSWVVGLIVDGVPKAYPLEKIEARDESLADTVGGTEIIVTHDPDSGAIRAKRADSGEQIPIVRSYWFAWQAFYPGTKLYGG